MPTGDFPPPKGMRWTGAFGWVPDLPPEWGKINGEDHPDTVVARVNYDRGLEDAAKMIEGFSADQIKMAAGEMTAQEMRTVKAVQRWWVSAIRHLGLIAERNHQQKSGTPEVK
jgi:hypothetical protein